jgi:type I restriction enzyme S subunit
MANNLNSRFADYLFQSRVMVGQFVTASKGVGDIQRDLHIPWLKDTCLPIPSSHEQAAIIRFLDHADRRIRRYIRAKQKLIALLNEQKQAIIHRAVTRGLDPNVRLKPSGVEWLGDVPEHWEVRRLKEVISPIEQGWSPQCDAQPAGNDEWCILKVGCVNRDAFDECQNKRLPSGLDPVPALEIQDGDILVSRANTRELLGLAALVIKPRPKLMLCDKLFRFRARSGLADSHFLVYEIRQRTSRAQIESSTNGASDSMQNIGQGVVRNLVMSLPPLAEQQQAVAALRDQTSSLAAAASRAQQEIALLREYRTRLISDVVTGKLDVRQAAAKLPDEIEEPEPLDEAETLAEGDEEGEGVDLDTAPEEAEV